MKASLTRVAATGLMVVAALLPAACSSGDPGAAPLPSPIPPATASATAKAPVDVLAFWKANPSWRPSELAHSKVLATYQATTSKTFPIPSLAGYSALGLSLTCTGPGDPAFVISTRSRPRWGEEKAGTGGCSAGALAFEYWGQLPAGDPLTTIAFTVRPAQNYRVVLFGID